jgi:CheY-like chemotaxis protein
MTLTPEREETDGTDPQRGRLVLVIDDDRKARDLLHAHLRSAGVRVATAATGAEGLHLARELKPDAITLDIMMTGLDGWSVLTELKSDPELADIPVVILSVVADAGLVYRLGISDYLVKPVDGARLASAIEEYRSPSASSAVLVVTNDLGTREVLHRLVSQLGLPPVVAGSGLDALFAVHLDRPSLILLDLTMPGFDVLQVLVALRAKQSWQSIPVVGLTPDDTTLEQRRSLDTVVQHLLAKGGLHVEEFVDQLRTLLTSH